MAKGGRGRRSVADRRVANTAAQHYPRAARVNELLREVLAEAVERIADKDERLALLTVTAVTSDPDQDHATVFFASLSEDARTGLAVHRLRLQAAIAGQVRLRRTPKLTFAVDPAVSTGHRVEEILRQLQANDHEGKPDEQ